MVGGHKGPTSSIVWKEFKRDPNLVQNEFSKLEERLDEISAQFTAHKNETLTARHKLLKDISAEFKQIVVQEPEQTVVVNADAPKIDFSNELASLKTQHEAI